MKKKPIQTEAFGLVLDKLWETFGLGASDFKLKNDRRLVMNVVTPKGELSIGLILFDVNANGNLYITTMDGMDRKPINRMLLSIQKKLNRKQNKR